MSRYKEGKVRFLLKKCNKIKVGFRWRTENEVISGKGQFSCGNKKCDEKKDLKSYEVNFAYEEKGRRCF
jgi:hypothetical protein